MLSNAYFLAKIGADTAKNEQHFAEILPKISKRGRARRAQVLDGMFPGQPGGAAAAPPGGDDASAFARLRAYGNAEEPVDVNFTEKVIANHNQPRGKGREKAPPPSGGQQVAVAPGGTIEALLKLAQAAVFPTPLGMSK